MKKVFSVMVLSIFALCLLSAISYQDFNYDSCIDQAQAFEEVYMEEFGDAEGAYEFGNNAFDDCVLDVDLAAYAYYNN
jgi:hypothetical protein